MRYAELKPGLPAFLFSTRPSQPQQYQQQSMDLTSSRELLDDEFGADEIDDQDMVDAGEQRLKSSPSHGQNY